MKVYVLDSGQSQNPPRIHVDCSGHVVTFTVTTANTEIPNTVTIDLEALLARNDISDFALYPIGMAAIPLTNVYALTSNSKLDLAGAAQSLGSAVVAGVVVQAKSDIQTVSIFVAEYNKNSVTVSGEAVLGDRLVSYQPLFQKLTVAIGERSGDLVTFAVNSTCLSPQTVYCETSAGVLLTPRVDVIDGQGIGYLSLAGLPSGYGGKVKAGFKYFSGLAEAQFTV